MAGRIQNLKTRLIKWYSNQPPKMQRAIATGAIVIMVVVFGFIAFQERDHRKEVEDEGTIKELNPRLRVLEKSLYLETTQNVKNLEKQLKIMGLELKAMQKELAQQGFKGKEDISAIKNEMQKTLKDLEREKNKSNEKRQTAWPAPPHSPEPPSSSPPPLLRAGQNALNTKPPAEKKEKKWIGGIGHATSEKPVTVPESQGKTKDTPDENRSVYLPPSFVSADLLSGFAAPTMEAAKSDPRLVLLRLQDLAVLPNAIKSDLKGCFALAEGYGNLADERAHLRLVRLSCIARDGTSVIDEKVKGFVVDEDGKIGLRGRVVTKSGALLARSFVAGFLDGFGRAIEEGAYDTSSSAIGDIRTLNPDKSLEAGIGRGIGEASGNLSKFYMELARQTFPVIEVGSGKRVSVVTSEGVELKIRTDVCLEGGRNGCRRKEDADGLGILATAF